MKTPPSASSVPANPATSSELTRTVAKNSAFVLGVQVVLKVLAFLFNIYVVRRLGDTYFGQYSIIIAYVDMFAIFTDWGMSPYALREMAKTREKTATLLPNIIVLRLLLSFVIMIIAPLTALWAGKSANLVTGIWIASAGLLIYAFQGPLDGALTARERLDYTSTFTFINQIIFWGLGTLLLINGVGFIGLIIARLSGVAIVGVLSGWMLAREKPGRLRVTPRRWPALFKAALPFGISTISYAFIQRFDTVFMSFILSAAEIGWYNVPWTLLNMTLLIAQSIAVAMYPSLVRSHTDYLASLPRITWQAIKYLSIVCLPIVAGGIVLAERIIITLYEATFSNAIPVLKVMLCALPSMFLLELLGRVADTLHLERPKARINIINAVIIVVLNLILVPWLGIVGAALALLGGQSIRLIQYWRLIGNDRLVGKQWPRLLRIILAGSLMSLLVFFLRNQPMFGPLDSKAGLFALISAGALIYGTGLYVFGGIEQREIKFVRDMILRRFNKGYTP